MQSYSPVAREKGRVKRTAIIASVSAVVEGYDEICRNLDLFFVVLVGLIATDSIVGLATVVARERRLKLALELRSPIALKRFAKHR